MYRKGKSLTLRDSCSPLCNNFTAHVDETRGLAYYGVVTRNYVNMVNCGVDGSSAVHRPIVLREQTGSRICPVTQARVLGLTSRTVVVVASCLGIMVADADTLTTIYWYSLHDNRTDTYGRGICGIGDNICVGTHDGYILVFDVPKKGHDVSLIETIDGHRESVWSLASLHDQFVSADNEGTLILWKSSGERMDKQIAISGTGYPCTSVALWRGLIIGGFGSGHIRIFSTLKGALLAEVTAHARWVNGIDVADSSGLLVSCSEDSFVRVWQLSTDISNTISHVTSVNVADTQLQGVQFIDSDGRAFGCTGYDSNEILFYTTAP